METIDNLIRILFDNVEKVLRRVVYENPPLFVLRKGTISCNDGTRLGVELVLDEDYLTGEQSVFLRFESQNSYLMEPLPCTGCISWLNDRQIVEMRENARSVLSKIQQMEASELELHIREDGMDAVDRILFSSGHMEYPDRVPASCLIAAFGEVFRGVKGLNEYCMSQSMESSPYVIRKTSLIEEMFKPDWRKYDYLICRNAEDAERRMGSLFRNNPGDAADAADAPPFLTYEEGTRYMTIH